MQRHRYQQEEAQAILRRALQASVSTPTPGTFSHEALRQMGEELGVDAATLDQAAREWDARERERRERRAFVAAPRRAFLAHLAPYLLVNAAIPVAIHVTGACFCPVQHCRSNAFAAPLWYNPPARQVGKTFCMVIAVPLTPPLQPAMPDHAPVYLSNENIVPGATICQRAGNVFGILCWRQVGNTVTNRERVNLVSVAAPVVYSEHPSDIAGTAKVTKRQS